MTLQEFEEEVKSNLRAFVLDYMEKHADNPEKYPLELPPANDGLWWEFFTRHQS